MGWLPLALLAAIFAALTAIFGKIGLERVDGTFATVVRAVIMAGFMVLAGWATGRFSPSFWQTLDLRAITFIVLSGAAGAASWLAFFLALKVGDASRVAPIDRLSVVFVILLAVLFLGEHFSPLAATGVGLMTLGAVLIAL